MHQNKIQFWCAGANEKRTGPNQREVRAWCRLVERARRTLSNNNCEVAMVEFAAGGGEGRWSLVAGYGGGVRYCGIDAVVAAALRARWMQLDCGRTCPPSGFEQESTTAFSRQDFPAKTFPPPQPTDSSFITNHYRSNPLSRYHVHLLCMNDDARRCYGN